MNKILLSRIGVTLLIVGLAAFSAFPLSETINLGLDLQGGMHLVYEVDTDEAIVAAVDNTTSDLGKFLEDKGVTPESVTRDGESIVAKYKSLDDRRKADEAIADSYSILEPVTTGDGTFVTYKYTAQYRDDMYENTVDQALETLRNRIDEFGVAEPSIQRQGDNRILIQLPGIEDRARAEKLIGQTAKLEFRMLNEKYSVREAESAGVPADSEILYGKEVDPITKETIRKIPYLVKKKVEVTGDMLASTDVSVGQMSLPYVSFTMNSEGTRLFGRVTTENQGKLMAIVLDGHVYSAPRIKEPITSGDGMIEGSFSYEEARDLAIVLRTGSLPARLIKLEERSVGPSLGRDSVRRGVNSIIVGAISVLLFMLLYYKFGGLIANVALFFNMVILAGALAYFGATLTLPGIAGIILTIGMAVDANVLVFERIREELQLGKTVRSAVDSGFSKAFLTIIDANVTTLIAAVVLFQFGTGPVKGFAITLCIGIVASLFTAIFVSRTLFNWYLGGRRLKELKI